MAAGGRCIFSFDGAVSQNVVRTVCLDTTVVPTYQFEDPQVSPARYFVLGFVVADTRNPCAPSWGTISAWMAPIRSWISTAGSCGCAG